MSFAAAATGSNAAAAAAGDVVVPAQLGFFAIYNPSLGMTDETIDDQIVYYASGPSSSSFFARRNSSASTSQYRHHQTPSSTSPPLGSSPSSCGLPSASHADERNERLRQIGLAQGMVAFGKSFSGDQPVDTVETDKTRVVLHELEPGWWLLVSINLTKLPALPGNTNNTNTTEYSCREVKPATLVLQDLLRAHAVFLLHHDASLSALYARTASPAAAAPSRSRFTALLARYWDVFLSSWSVLLHGNPVRDVLPGVRMAACGELGVGVGEEDRGSGEREVLEGLVEQTDGLVDLVVCRFGRAADDNEADELHQDSRDSRDSRDSQADSQDIRTNSNAWLGSGRGIGAEDGAIFLGVGALSRPSLRTVSYWMEDIYSWGKHAYGVAEDPSVLPRHAKRRKRRSGTMTSISEQQQQEEQQQQKQRQKQRARLADLPPLLPPPPVTLLARRAKSVSSPIATSSVSQSKRDATEEAALSVSPASFGPMDKYRSFMKFGYGTYWSLGAGGGGGGGGGSKNDDSVDPLTVCPAETSTDAISRASSVTRKRHVPRTTVGQYLIGLTSEGSTTEAKNGGDDGQQRSKTGPRTVVVDLIERRVGRPSSQDTLRYFSEPQGLDDDDADDDETATATAATATPTPAADNPAVRSGRLRVVVFAKQPFLYAFFFQAADGEGATKDEETVQTLLSRQVTVLHKPLLASTSYRPSRPSLAGVSAPSPSASLLSVAVAAAPANTIYDLVWDPRALTIHSTIPNIPDPGTLLSTYATTRANAAELERTCKTSRGWWVVWNRVVERSSSSAAGSTGSTGSVSDPLLEEDEDDGSDRSGFKTGSDASRPTTATVATGYAVSKEIFLLRRAGDHVESRLAASAMRAISGSYLGRGGTAADGAAGGTGWTDGASRLTQGMGVDTKRYIEGLLSLNR
ncbi:hypothetical protein CMQ_887 [Grosmannia clavigera kw1407]|uniref:CCZ1/INTU/HSP4 first Longin domain-containing protein n=1 Tax=Grosmannia clavigera (strain kw1407 / UAMH 11150) TaxID=655863 RepID=F0XCP5_GROCL|nr:uncharacterized protein CMQ_887 [Grosmannia clavigera kw1407]EFX03959.1 hypothetical protein CMQ_887 [Grosmannia clavigera kw1407]